MRRLILITVNSLFLICAGLWIGSLIGVGALAAPAAFRILHGIAQKGTTVPIAGYVIGEALRRANTLSLVLIALMLAVAVFELFYRKRQCTKRLLLGRLIVVLAALVVTVYISQTLMLRMETERALGRMDLFDAMHAQYKAWSWVQVALGMLSIILTNAVNISPRRDGGHPRGVK